MWVITSVSGLMNLAMASACAAGAAARALVATNRTTARVSVRRMKVMATLRYISALCVKLLGDGQLVAPTLGGAAAILMDAVDDGHIPAKLVLERLAGHGID